MTLSRGVKSDTKTLKYKIMKREIKFRAWEYTHERTHGEAWRDTPMIWKMNYNPKVYGDEILGGYSEVNLNYALNNGGDDSLINNDYPTIFMQYTGLKDKNGKEVYEGDIIHFPHNDYIEEGYHQVFYYNDSFVTANVLFSDIENANKNTLTWIIKRGGVVIGNIYENPELLK